MMSGAGRHGQAPWSVGVEGEHLLSQQVCQEDDRITLRAAASQADETCEGVAVGATLVANGAGLASWALVDGVLDKLAPSLQFGSHLREVQTHR
jgi:hypothetical protein